MYCRICGKELCGGDYCPHCGAKILNKYPTSIEGGYWCEPS